MRIMFKKKGPARPEKGTKPGGSPKGLHTRAKPPAIKIEIIAHARVDLHLANATGLTSRGRYMYRGWVFLELNPSIGAAMTRRRWR